MSDRFQDPLRMPVDQEFEPRFQDMEDWSQMNFAGPGGRTTNIENNEKGILDHTVLRTMDPFRQAALGSSHDAHTMGIYSDTDSKFAD